MLRNIDMKICTRNNQNEDEAEAEEKFRCEARQKFLCTWIAPGKSSIVSSISPKTHARYWKIILAHFSDGYDEIHIAISATMQNNSLKVKRMHCNACASSTHTQYTSIHIIYV